MTMRNIAILFILTVLLAACAGPVSTEAPAEVPVLVTEIPIILTPTLSVPTPYPEPAMVTSVPNPYPEPAVVTSVPTQSAYPAPGTPGTGTVSIPASGYEPQPGDENLTRGQVFLDMTNSQVILIASEPSQAIANLEGDLPDPCHKLRVAVTPPDANNMISLDVYSVLDPGVICTTVLEPFTASIPLGSYTTGTYTVLVNGEKLGEFNPAVGVQPGDEKLTRGEASVDMDTSALVFRDSQPLEVSASLQGYLSDPCHQLRIAYTPADEQNRINLEVYSVFDPSTACITMIQPFNIIYPLGSYSGGHYTVYVNGALLEEFDG